MKKILEYLIQKIYHRYRNNYYRSILFPVIADSPKLKQHLELFESTFGVIWK